MNITLTRHTSGAKSTQGRLYIDGEFVCHTLENPWLNNERRVSCIPGGTYELGLRTEGNWANIHSLRRFPNEPIFHQGMIEVLNVPNRSAILFHWGNLPEETDGCMLVGERPARDKVIDSVKAYRKIYPRIVTELRCGWSVPLTIEGVLT